MISDAALEEAIAKGIVSQEQAKSLRILEHDRATQEIMFPDQADDKKPHFIRGFQNILMTLGLFSFIGALGFLAFVDGPFSLMGIVLTIIWLLGEFFTRHRRMVLVSTVLAGLFASGVFVAAEIFLETYGFYNENSGRFERPDQYIWAALATLLLTGLHYLRFRVLISLAIGMAALIGMMMAALYETAPDFAVANAKAVLFAAGCLTFALALGLDLSDLARVTSRAGKAFWLYGLAITIILYSVISPFWDKMENLTMGESGLILSIFVVLTVTAMILDRRIILASGCIYASVVLVKQRGVENGVFLAFLLALGALILLLSAGWQPMRTALLKLLPADLVRRLPHPLLSSS